MLAATSHLCTRLDVPSEYLVRKARRLRTGMEHLERSTKSRTVYVGGLQQHTGESSILALFSRCGRVASVIMGLDRVRLTPCGFCFVVYRTQTGANNSVKLLNGAVLDGGKLDVDLDPGFEEGRQYGRGITGGQRGKENAVGPSGPHRGSAYVPRGGRGRGRGRRGRGSGFSGYGRGSSYNGSSYNGSSYSGSSYGGDSYRPQ